MEDVEGVGSAEEIEENGPRGRPECTAAGVRSQKRWGRGNEASEAIWFLSIAYLPQLIQKQYFSKRLT